MVALSVIAVGLADLADHVGLQLAGEDGVHNTGAGAGGGVQVVQVHQVQQALQEQQEHALPGQDAGLVDEVPVQQVQGRYEELVRVLGHT